MFYKAGLPFLVGPTDAVTKRLQNSGLDEYLSGERLTGVSAIAVGEPVYSLELPVVSQVVVLLTKDLLGRILHPDPLKRANIDEILAHEWCQCVETGKK